MARPLASGQVSWHILLRKDNYLRAYTVAVAAFALDAPVKWLDNFLSHHRVRGIEAGKQGIQRRIPAESLVVLAIARTLNRMLGAPLSRALELAESAVNSPDGEIQLGTDGAPMDDLRLIANVASVRRTLEDRLREAVEFGATPRRGRPPKRAV